MRLSQAWIIAAKDFQTFTRKGNILYSTFGVPLLVSVLLPGVLSLVVHRKAGSPALGAALAHLLPAFAFFYLILAGIIPTTIASYTLVGEKVEKSLEPLLATPTTDSEILVGKSIAAIVPPLGAILVASAIFMALADAVTRGTLGNNFFPNGNALVVLFVMAPLAAAMSVAWNVVISARVSDVRIAQQMGALVVVPFAGIYVSGEVGLISLGVTRNLLLVAAGELVAAVLLLSFAVTTFRREAILTRWK